MGFGGNTEKRSFLKWGFYECISSGASFWNEQFKILFEEICQGYALAMKSFEVQKRLEIELARLGIE